MTDIYPEESDHMRLFVAILPAPKGEMLVKKLSLMKTTCKDGKLVYTEVSAYELSAK